MTLLHTYLLKQFYKFLATVGSGFVALYLLIDFFEKWDNFSAAGKPLSEAITYFILFIPSVIDQLGPILILLSGVISLGILNHSHELTALKAGGLPLRKIVRPLIAGGVLTTIIFLAAAQWLLPITVAKTNDIWLEGIKGETPAGIVRNNRYYYRGIEGFYSFDWPDTNNFEFKNFSYSTWNDDYDLRQLLSAKTASWNKEKNDWTLTGGVIQLEGEDQPYTTRPFTTKTFSFPENPELFRTPQNQEAESSLSQLLDSAINARTDFESRDAWIAFLGRVSYIFLGLPLLLLGLPILLISYQKWGRDLSIAIPASCALAFFAWALWGALQSLAIAGSFSPWLAASLIHVTFASIGLYLLRRFDI